LSGFGGRTAGIGVAVERYGLATFVANAKAPFGPPGTRRHRNAIDHPFFVFTLSQNRVEPSFKVFLSFRPQFAAFDWKSALDGVEPIRQLWMFSRVFA